MRCVIKVGSSNDEDEAGNPSAWLGLAWALGLGWAGSGREAFRQKMETPACGMGAVETACCLLLATGAGGALLLGAVLPAATTSAA